MNVVSYSRIREWHSCRWRYAARYHHGLVPVGVIPKRDLGSLVHLYISTILSGNSVDEATQRLDKWVLDRVESVGTDSLELSPLVDSAKSIGDRTVKSVKDQGYVPLSGYVERALNAKLSGWDGFVGIVDVVLQDSDGGLWPTDFKVFEALKDESHEETNLQNAVYQQLLALHGIKTVGSITWQIRARVPAVPKMNKDGTISRQDLVTTWETYSSFVAAVGKNPQDYLDMKEKLDAKQWESVVKYPRGQHELTAVWEEVVVNSAREMLGYHNILGNAVAPRALGTFNCRGCWIKDLCLESLRGGDVDHYIKLHSKREEDEQFDTETGDPA